MNDSFDRDEMPVHTLASFASLGLALAACTSPQVMGSRNHDTSLREDEFVGLYLTSYTICLRHRDEGCWQDVDMAAKQREFEKCMGDAMRAEKPSVTLLRSQVFMPVLDKFSDKDPKLWLEDQLKNRQLRGGLANLGLKYLVVISVSTGESERKTRFGVTDGGGGHLVVLGAGPPLCRAGYMVLRKAK